MWVAAAEQPQRATWQYEAAGLLAAGVWTERTAGRGEDAEPRLAHHVATGRGLVAVFDGAGGAGAAGVGRGRDGIERTGAWVGSRVARAMTEQWFLDAVRHRLVADPGLLRDALAGGLGEVRRPGRRRIVGSMCRELPTTVAGLAYRIGLDRVEWQALWAGDSRCFSLDACRGLQQLSRDDTEEGDALVLLTEDPPMTNLASADREFRINHGYGDTAQPVVLLCATDGFFGYVHTPAEFEYVLLDALMGAQDLAHWAELLATDVAAYTADDASLALVAMGHRDFDELRDRFTGRATRLLDEHWLPMRRAVAGDRDQLVAARADSWTRYRHTYEDRMPGVPT